MDGYVNTTPLAVKKAMTYVEFESEQTAVLESPRLRIPDEHCNKCLKMPI